jgi:hypothetical protein
MHKQKNSRMSHMGFFLLGTQKESIFWEFFLVVILMTSLDHSLMHVLNKQEKIYNL